ncbi:hypothetical protein [Nocardia sp. NBC_00403]|uniref:hypothetical protein n=1 Tax=Nocardia sp. NBC_00403 TaxID=2975990 RepID=UPI002E229814
MSFPTPYATLLAADFTMEQALEQALLDTRASFPLFGDIPHVALSIASVEGPDDFRHAGVDFGRTFYSASLLEVAIPYCAYQLRTAVEDAGNATGATNAASTYAAARATIDPEAAGAVPAIAAAGIPVAQRVPQYEQIFATIPRVSGGVAVTLNAAFERLPAVHSTKSKSRDLSSKTFSTHTLRARRDRRAVSATSRLRGP